MQFIRSNTLLLVIACKGNYMAVMITLFIFSMIINLLLAVAERLMFGERFEHWIDVVHMVLLFIYTIYCGRICAAFNIQYVITKPKVN